MGKMIGYVKGADVFLVIALLIFLAVFVSAIVYMYTLNKKTMAEIADLPLDNSNKNTTDEE